MRATALLLLVATVACSDPKKACEHAREVMAQNWTRSGNEALQGLAPDERAAVQKDMDAEHARADGRFIELCVALPEPGQKCIARVDELLAADRDMRAARDKCAPDETGFPNAKCVEAAEAKGKQVTADCENELKSFSEKLFAE